MPIGHHATVPLGGYPLEGIDTGDSVDFQVQSQIGYYSISFTGMFVGVIGGAMDFYYVFAGQSSGWSNTQTVMVGENSIYSSPSPTPTPTSPTPTSSVPEFSWLIILPLIIFILSIAVIVRQRKLGK